MSPGVIQLISVIIGAGGLLGAILGFLKLRPENDSVVVTAAQGALLVQSGVVDGLQEELNRAKEIAQAQAQELREVRQEGRDLRREVSEMRRELRTVTEDRDRLAAENETLRGRVTMLEGRLAKVEGVDGA